MDRDDPEIVVGGRGFDLVVIRGVANLMPVGRKGVVVLSAEREHGSVVVAGREIGIPSRDNPCNRSRRNFGRSFSHENMATLALFVSVPVPVEQAVENEGLDLRFLRLLKLLGIAVFFFDGRTVAFGIDIRSKENVLA